MNVTHVGMRAIVALVVWQMLATSMLNVYLWRGDACGAAGFSWASCRIYSDTASRWLKLTPLWWATRPAIYVPIPSTPGLSGGTTDHLG